MNIKELNIFSDENLPFNSIIKNIKIIDYERLERFMKRLYPKKENQKVNLLIK